MKRRKVGLLVLSLALCLLSACASPTVSYFPVQKDIGPAFLALNYGRLVDENGCLRLERDGYSYLLIWPHGYSYRISDNKVEVLNEQGEFICRTGQLIQMFGGETSSPEALTGAVPPPNCPGPYWKVGGGIEGWSSGIAWHWAFNTAASMAVAVGMLVFGSAILRRRTNRAKP